MGTAHICHLRLPNSYAPDDGLVVETNASAPDKAEAAEDACLAAIAFLCANRDGLRNVLLRPAHWKKPIQELIDDIGRIVDSAATYEPLAVHNRHGSGFTGELADVSEPDLERAAELVHLCLRTHNGSFAPSSISHKQIAAEAGQSSAKVYTQLVELLPKKSFLTFIQQHPEFKCEYKRTILHIAWASGENAAASGAPGAEDVRPAESFYAPLPTAPYMQLLAPLPTAPRVSSDSAPSAPSAPPDPYMQLLAEEAERQIVGGTQEELVANRRRRGLIPPAAAKAPPPKLPKAPPPKLPKRPIAKAPPPTPSSSPPAVQQCENLYSGLR